MLSNKLKRLIERYEIISFDVFDTCILRPYSAPEDMFFYMEQAVRLPGWAELRMNAQKIAWDTCRSQEKEDITLDEIYRQLPEKYRSLQKIEKELEISQSLANPEIFQIYQYALSLNKRIIFISDMYLPHETMGRILEKNGYANYEKLFVSCRYGKLKSTENLFKVALKEINATPEMILHIGDNVQNDVKAFSKMGGNAFQYPAVLQQYIKVRPEIESLLRRFAHQPDLSAVVMLAAINYVQTGSIESSEDYWYQIGYNYAGPLCCSFLSWILTSIPDSVKDVLLIARDGYLLHKIIQACYSGNRKFYYIYAPRSLNLLCQLDYKTDGKLNLAYLHTIIEYYRHKHSQLKDAPVISSIEEGVAYITAHRALFEQLADKTTRQYTDYLRKQLVQAQEVALVDSVSMFYSSQNFLEKLNPNTRFYGLYYAIQAQALVNPRAISYTPKRSYSEDLAFVEFLLSSPEFPISHIENQRPVYKQNVSPQEQTRVKNFKFIEQGAVDFAKRFYALFPDFCFLWKNYTVSEWFSAFIGHPSIKDKEQFQAIQFAYDLEHQNYDLIFPSWYYNQSKKSQVAQREFRFWGISVMVIYSVHKTDFYLADFLHLWQVKKSEGKIKYKLFGFIPVFTIRSEEK